MPGASSPPEGDGRAAGLAEEGVQLPGSAAARLALQRQAPRNLRLHGQRALLRFAVLVAGDLAALVVMRALLGAARSGTYGAALGAAVREVLPAGYLNGWQFAVALLVGLLVTGTYGPGDRRRDLGRLFAGCALAAALPLWSPLWTDGFGTVLLQYGLTVVLVWAVVAGERLAVDRVKEWVRPAARDALDTLFVGPGAECRKAMASPAFAAGSEYRPIGFVDTEAEPAVGALGQVGDLPVLLAASGAGAVVICGHLDDMAFQGVVDAALAGGCQLLALPRTVEVAGVQPHLVWRRGVPLVELTAPSLKGWQLLAKRMLDVFGAAFGLLVFGPLFGIIGLAIKLESPGPIIFGHRRVGLRGRVFRCYKFRSMHADAEQRLRSDPELYRDYVLNNYKLPEDRDPRITQVGRFLRKTSLDEVPQLINVLKGDMSLVGPRPIVPEELAHYGHRAAVFLSLKPGITGAWQVSGRSGVGYPDRAELELDYIRNWSLALDLWILLRTVPVVVTRRGAH